MPSRYTHVRTRPSLGALLLPPLLALSGCAVDDGEDAAAAGGGRMLFTLNSDYKAGTYSAWNLDSAEARKDLGTMHSDAVVRWFGGDDIFIVNRLGRDNAQVVDRGNLQTVLQFPFPAASNPQDIELKDSLIYAGFFSLPAILVYHQGQGDRRDSIDISAYADTADRKPEVADLRIVGDHLYVLAGNINTKTYVPLTARLVRIRLGDKQSRGLDLPFGNPAAMAWDSAAGVFYIPCRGAYGAKDGGIVIVDPAEWRVVDTLITEEALGGDVNSVRLHGGRLYMDLSDSEGGKPRESIVAIDPAEGGEVTRLLTLSGYKFGGMAVDGKTGILYVGDREKGLRRYDLAAGKEADSAGVDLGDLPILDMVLVD